jgi:succinate dehydrogenase / fumarate reductase flavoprotein subunit
MERYSPDQMELDARDVVARAIAQEIEDGRGSENGGVYLDISHRDRDFIERRLPRMYERFAELGADMAEEPVEVSPTAHYGMGGVVVDDGGETDVDGLYAIGETMAGVHGANRLGGNSLAETIAYGAVTGEAIADRLGTAECSRDERALYDRAGVHLRGLRALAHSDGANDPEALLDEVRSVLWEQTGILRDDEGLERGIERLETLRSRATDLSVGGPTSRSYEFALNLGFALLVADAVLRGARERTESRGAHFRTDHPDTDPEWRRNVRYRRDSIGAGQLSTAPVGEPSEAVQAALDAGHELDYHQLE